MEDPEDIQSRGEESESMQQRGLNAQMYATTNKVPFSKVQVKDNLGAGDISGIDNSQAASRGM